MADDVKDIAIYTGSEWTSLSELTAGVVDVNLPIQSVDGTVVLSDSSGSFVVSTGNPSKAQLTVRPDGNIGHAYPGQANINFVTYNKFGISTVEEIGIMAAPRFDGQPSTLCASIQSQPEFTDVVASNVVHFMAKDDRAGNKSFAGKQVGFLSNDLAKSTALNIGFEAGQSGADNFAFLASATAPSQFNGGIFTPSVRGLADTDAEVTLGGNFVVSTGGTQSVIVTQDGRVGFGATPGSGVQFQNTASAATGMRSDITHNSSTRYANSDGQLLVTNAAATADIAAMSGFRVVGRSSVGATVDQYYGIYVAEVPAAAGIAAGVRSVINGDGFDQGIPTVSGHFNVYADGSAPNYFGGDVRITPTKQLNVSKIVGAASPDSDASVSLGNQATLKAGDGSEYVPTDSASIATKKIVDDKIWVGTTAQYLNIDIRDILPTTLYCLTD
jgi:hypothetical protein